MLTSPPEIFALADTLKRREENFVLATVIAVRGAASAKTGSKALFNSEGKNLLGWVGGGCAESFLARQSVEALQARTPRIVNVDLDDEVFGLMPCGGVMDVYLEPHFPAREIRLPEFGTWSEPISQFFNQLGYAVNKSERVASLKNWPEAFVSVAKILSLTLDQPLGSWREIKGVATGTPPRLARQPSQFIILGQTRITEELARLSTLLNWRPEIFAHNANADGFVRDASVCELPLDLSTLDLKPGAWVVVASHHQLDHQFIASSLRAGADYVALVASEKRSKLIVEELRTQSFSDRDLAKFFAPAGLTMPTETPTQIAFSILCEILFLQSEDRWI